MMHEDPQACIASDIELLSRWAKGDKGCADQLIERHFATVYRFFSTKVAVDADDLVQQTFLACLEARGRYRQESSFKTFLLSIARHQLYAHYRERKRRSILDFSVTSVYDLAASATSAIAEREHERLLLEALQRIPLEAQILIELTYWEELSGRELAEVLELPPNTIYSKLRRARIQVREALAAVAAASSSSEFKIGLEALEAWAKEIRSKR
jgi:RNA polymerase sigma factor (sigma-70 family)